MTYTLQETRDKYLMTLVKTNTDPETFSLLESLINDHFDMINHMETTSLYDVLMYEKRVTDNLVEPIEILKYENEKLKKEVNKLRKELGKIEKYKESTDEN